jgi:subtilisin family serine protease
MQLEKRTTSRNLDPKLQFLLDRRQRGINPPATAATAEGEIGVIAKVSDVESWLTRTDVFAGADLGVSEDGSHIVTARVPLNRVDVLRQLPYVLSLKPAKPIKPALRATVEEIGARLDLLPPDAQGEQGKGVVVGIVDFGCDFVHDNFRKSDGTTRLLALWNQAASANPDSPFSYGKVHTSADINNALQSPEPYLSLGYNYVGRGSHGTHVTDIACGNGRGSGFSGVAPQADIVFVELDASDVPFQGSDVIDSSFGDSVHLLEAIRFIFDVAGDRPCVINLSLGTNGGPHDGSTLVEQGIDAIVRERSNRAVVIAAGNSHQDGIHASGTVLQGGSTDLVWQIDDIDFTHNELEIWYPKDDRLQLELLDENGNSMGTVDPGASARILAETGETLFFIAHRIEDPNNKDNAIGIFMETNIPSSKVPAQITLRLHGTTIVNGNFHAWIERDDVGPSRFAPPNDNSHTLGSLSCGKCSIVVGSYDAHTSGQPLSFFSSAGPTRDNRQKPEISAPGHQVWAANALTRIGVTRMSGTSMAAPAVTGVVALMLAEARSLNKELTCEQIRDILSKTARPNPPSASWDSRYGMGRVYAKAALQAVRDLLTQGK